MLAAVLFAAGEPVQGDLEMVGHFDQVVKAGALFAGLKALILPERDT